MATLAITNPDLHAFYQNKRSCFGGLIYLIFVSSNARQKLMISVNSEFEKKHLIDVSVMSCPKTMPLVKFP